MWKKRGLFRRKRKMGERGKGERYLGHESKKGLKMKQRNRGRGGVEQEKRSAKGGKIKVEPGRKGGQG